MSFIEGIQGLLDSADFQILTESEPTIEELETAADSLMERYQANGGNRLHSGISWRVLCYSYLDMLEARGEYVFPDKRK